MSCEIESIHIQKKKMRNGCIVVMMLLMLLMMMMTTSNAQHSHMYHSKDVVIRQSFCVNENDDSFINKCHREYPVSYWSLFANTALQWVNPRMLAITAVCIYIVMPLLLFSNVRLRDIRASHLKRYNNLQIQTLNFLHRMCYTLVLDVALYAVFRQSRPCRCTDDGGKTFTHVGSIYGMPSGDAMSGAIFGAFIYDLAPFHPIIGRVIGALVIPVICMERVVLGYHTVAQVTVGSLMGIALHVWNTRMPQWTVYLDAIVQFVAGIILLNVDPALRYGYNDSNNLFAWFMWGVGFQVFVIWCLLPFFVNPFRGRNWSKLNWSIHGSNGNFFQRGDDVELFDTLIHTSTSSPTDVLEDSDKTRVVGISSPELRSLGNIYWTMIGVALLLLFNLFSQWITQDAILVKRRV
jgi:membrane-associated phospholipid phosphatase